MEQDGLKMGCDGLDWVPIENVCKVLGKDGTVLSSLLNSILWIGMDLDGLEWVGMDWDI